MSKAHNPWDDERVLIRAKILWKDGLSTSLVARSLNQEFHLTLTRNAVIGKLYRLGIDNAWRGIKASNQSAKRLPYQTDRTTTAKTPSKRPPHVRSLDFRNNPAEPMRKAAPVPMMVEDLTFARPWEQRLKGQCAWPIGDSPAIFSCCHPVATDRQYCAHHFTRMFPGKSAKPRPAKDYNTVRPNADEGEPIPLDRLVA